MGHLEAPSTVLVGPGASEMEQRKRTYFWLSLFWLSAIVMFEMWKNTGQIREDEQGDRMRPIVFKWTWGSNSRGYLELL